MNRRYISALFLAPLALAACGEILSIEEAFVDPSLGGRSGSGGSDATAGTSEPTSGGPTSGGPAGGSSSGGQSGGTGGGVGSTLCDQYCKAMGQWCSASENLQYTDTAQCMKICDMFEVGSLHDEGVNTAYCRFDYASNARYETAEQRTNYCRWAGAGSDDSCGSNCEGFCTVMMETCTEEIAGVHHYATFDACLRDCATLDQIPYIHEDISVADSDTLQCRLYHVMSAAMYDPEEHCGHAVGFALCEPQGGTGAM